MEIPERSGFKSDRDGPGVLSRNSADTPLLFDGFKKRSPQLKHRDVKTAKIRQSYFEINTYTTEEAVRSEEAKWEQRRTGLRSTSDDYY